MIADRLFSITALIAVCCLVEITLARDAIRLPKNLRPYNYTVRLRPDIYSSQTDFTFSGSVLIDFDVVQTTNKIVVNQRGLTPENFFLTLAPDSIPANVPRLQELIVKDTEEVFEILLNGDLVQNAKYRMLLIFKGDMPVMGGSGIYVDYYTENGERRHLVATQFQRDATRTAFPCFDEPEFKANFNIELERRESRTSLSNGDLVQTIDLEDGWKRDIFERTPYMSCYLVAFVISDFEHVEFNSDKGRRIRVWVQRSYIHKVNFTVSVAGKIQDWFEDWTDYEHQTSKTDHVGLPNKGGAMENWGLILYDENALLFDPENEPVSFKMRAASLIAHEVAHFWFGNLITCEWWSDTWLNEGFAAFFQWEPLGDVLNWNHGMMQHIRAVNSIKGMDELESALPVYRPDVQLPSQAPSAFSRFTYSKGGALLRMFQQWIGKPIFQRSIRRYLKKFAFKSVVTQDLWDCIQDELEESGVSNFNVTENFNPWVNQRGISRIQVERKSNNLDLTQNRYPDFSGDDNYLWPVPVTVVTEGEAPGNNNVQFTLRQRNDDFTPNNLGNWYGINSRGSGYYRTLYDKAGEDDLLRTLENDISKVDDNQRLIIMDDNLLRFDKSEIKEVEALRFTKFLRNEETAGPWNIFSQSFQEFYSNIVDISNDTALRDYTRYLVDNMYGKVNFEPVVGEAELTKLTREVVSGLACGFGNQQCIDRALELVNQYRGDKDNNPIPADQRLNAYCTSLSYGDNTRENFFFIEELLEETNSLPEGDALFRSLACVSSVSLVNEYLDRLLLNSTTYYDDAGRVARMFNLLDNERGRATLIPRLNDFWIGDYPQGQISLTLVKLCEQTFQESKANEIKRILSERPENFDYLWDILNDNQNWVAEEYGNIRQWLVDNTPTNYELKSVFTGQYHNNQFVRYGSILDFENY
ncbi:DgyrCDS5497 [Dimorphilus gyrociliatus]|uniref:Aminopeptidase n=1 Tax=Dimorphilus gyrociliatus TaxID=2664684 RepID=A0A7I8VK28_9ANNE|nr:DgyrCDS5497 [Dimorphilus gyrociliatus]